MSEATSAVVAETDAATFDAAIDNDEDDSSSGGQYDSKTRISSLSELQEKAPKVYIAVLMGIGMEVCGHLHRANERMLEKMKESRR